MSDVSERDFWGKIPGMEEGLLNPGAFRCQRCGRIRDDSGKLVKHNMCRKCYPPPPPTPAQRARSRALAKALTPIMLVLYPKHTIKTLRKNRRERTSDSTLDPED